LGFILLSLLVKNISKKLFLVLIIIASFLLPNTFLSWPRPSEAAVNPSPKVKAQIRKLQAQIKQLKLVLDQKSRVTHDATADYENDTARLLPPPVSTTPALTSLALTSLSPNLGGFGTVVSIKGYGFSRTSNDIYYSFAVAKRVASPDGQTLTFTMDLFSSIFSQIRQNPQNWQKASKTMPIGIFVKNDKGTSNQLIFNLNMAP